MARNKSLRLINPHGLAALVYYIFLGAKLLCEHVCPSPTHAVNGVTIFLSWHKLNNLAFHRKFEKVSSSFIFTGFSLKSRLLILTSWCCVIFSRNLS